MKIEHISKLILKFIGGGIVNFPTRFLKWIKVESCDCNGGSDDGGDDGGDSQDAVTSEDFNSFYISVINNNYVDTYNNDDTLQISDLFEVSNINVLKGLLSLGTDNVEANSDINICFDDIQIGPDNEGQYEHSINIYPHRGEHYIIEINTTHTISDDIEGEQTYIYGIGLDYDGEDTLTVGYVNTPVIGE